MRALQSEWLGKGRALSPRPDNQRDIMSVRASLVMSVRIVSVTSVTLFSLYVGPGGIGTALHNSRPGLGLQSRRGLRDCSGTGTAIPERVEGLVWGWDYSTAHPLSDWDEHPKAFGETATLNLGLCASWGSIAASIAARSIVSSSWRAPVAPSSRESSLLARTDVSKPRQRPYGPAEKFCTQPATLKKLSF